MIIYKFTCLVDNELRFSLYNFVIILSQLFLAIESNHFHMQHENVMNVFMDFVFFLFYLL